MSLALLVSHTGYATLALWTIPMSIPMSKPALQILPYSPCPTALPDNSHAHSRSIDPISIVTDSIVTE